MFLSKIKIKCNQITSVWGFGSWLEGGGILPIAPENYAWKMVTKLVDVLAPLQLSGIDLEYATSNLVRLTSPTWLFFGVNEAPKTIVVNGNHLEFCQYFSIYCKTRYLIHLTICNEHILTTSDQNRNLIAYIMDSFDSFFHLF